MASELEELRRSLDGLRSSVLRKLTGLSEADARRSTVPSGTNLAGLVRRLCGVASRRILTALMSGVTDPAALVLLGGGSKVSAADLTEALTGRFTEHHALMTRLLLNRIDRHTSCVTR